MGTGSFSMLSSLAGIIDLVKFGVGIFKNLPSHPSYMRSKASERMR
jgi:hypothetical protein